MEQRFTYLFKVCYWNEATRKKEVGYHCLEAYSFDEAATIISKYYNGSILSFVVDCLGETIVSLNKDQYIELVKRSWREQTESNSVNKTTHYDTQNLVKMNGVMNK